MPRLLTAAVVALAAMLAAPATPTEGATTPHRAAAVVPSLRVSTVASGLDVPWDVQSIGGDKLLITERTTRRLLLWDHGKVRRVAFPSASVWAASETGLMSLAVDPKFASNRRFYTCQGGARAGSGHEVRVVAWRLNQAATSATRVRFLLRGLPATSGRHGGCRLLITRGGALMVGTGDAAVGTNARNRSSLGGKTLRLNRLTGAPWPTNPFIRSRSFNARYVLTFGHRNVQGLAQRSDGSIWSVEHGTDRDDEVNRLFVGRDYGWNPTPGYNESKPMTDQRLPGQQINARWRSGKPTIATSGAAWVQGKQWGALNGTLAVAALKGERLLFMRFDSAGRLVRVRTPAALRSYGRLRSVTRGASGDLLVTTANGGGVDRVLRVHPRG
jgi:glucose/arabinose dehydrogenase